MINLSSNSFGNDSQATNTTRAIAQNTMAFLHTGDFLLASVFFGSILFILVSALLVRFSPLFLPAYVVFTLLATWIALIMKPALVQILNSFSWTADFPLVTNIITYLPIITAIIGGLIILVQYAFRTEM